MPRGLREQLSPDEEHVFVSVAQHVLPVVLGRPISTSARPLESSS